MAKMPGQRAAVYRASVERGGPMWPPNVADPPAIAGKGDSGPQGMCPAVGGLLETCGQRKSTPEITGNSPRRSASEQAAIILHFRRSSVTGLYLLEALSFLSAHSHAIVSTKSSTEKIGRPQATPSEPGRMAESGSAVVQVFGKRKEQP